LRSHTNAKSGKSPLPPAAAATVTAAAAVATAVAVAMAAVMAMAVVMAAVAAVAAAVAVAVAAAVGMAVRTIWHVVHRVEAMRICSTIVVDNNKKHDSVNNWSFVNLAQVLIVPQLGGHRGQWRGNEATRSTILLA
jgi:hypothetical protein